MTNKEKFIQIIDRYAYFWFTGRGVRLKPQLQVNCSVVIINFMDKYFNRHLPKVKVCYRMSNNKISVQNIKNISMVIDHTYNGLENNKKKFLAIKKYLDRRKEQNRKHFTEEDWVLVEKIDSFKKILPRKYLYKFNE